jgi:hypothetical protein
MLIQKISKKLGYVFASLVLMTAQMTPFFVFGGQAGATAPTPSLECGDLLFLAKYELDDNGSFNFTTDDDGQDVVMFSQIVEKEDVDGVEEGEVIGFDWDSTVPVDKVVVKAGEDNLTQSGNELTSGTYKADFTGNTTSAVSHVTFCYDKEPDTGSITIKKNAIDDSSQVFKFTTTGLDTDVSGFELVDDATTGLPEKVFNDLESGVYTITETPTTGWSFDGVVCSQGSSVQKDGATITINLAEGQDVSCTFTNREDEVPDSPKLTLIKEVKNENGGTALPDDFKLTVGGVVVDSGETKEYTAGVPYELNETLLPGYKFVSITGDDKCPEVLGGTVTLAYEDDITCKITNEDIAPSLTLVKKVINDNGGKATPDQFKLTIDGKAVKSGEKNYYNTDVSLAINETQLAGYKFVSITGDGCPSTLGGMVTLSLAEDVVCTITNDDIPVTIVATKIVCDDELLLPGWGTGNGENITSTTAIDWVTENAGCELAEGWNFEYAFNNAANPGDNIGDTAWADFGPTKSDGETSVEINDVSDVNRIWVREQLKDGYLGFTFNTKNQTNVDAISAELYCHRDVLNYDNYDFIDRPTIGNTYYCVAWNVGLGRIEVLKYNDKNENGTRENETEEKMNDWEISIFNSENQLLEKKLTGVNGKGKVRFDNLTPGTYKVCETNKEGWVNTQPGTPEPCYTVKVKSGETKSVKFGNAQKKTYVYVEKETYPYDKDEKFTFTVTNNEIFSGYLGFTTNGMGKVRVYPGAVLVEEPTERMPSSWYKVYENCYKTTIVYKDDGKTIDYFIDGKSVGVSFTAKLGQDYRCVFVNEKTGKVNITKFNDKNNNGKRDEGEEALPGWDMVLTPSETCFVEADRVSEVIALASECEEDEEPIMQTTNSEGVAVFNNLKPGEYIFDEVLQTGWTQTVKYCEVEYREDLSRNTILNGEVTHEDDRIWVGSGDTVECFVGNYKAPVPEQPEEPEEPVTPPSVLGVTTPPAVLEVTGDNQSSYMFTTGLTLIAATLVVASNRRRETVSTK